MTPYWYLATVYSKHPEGLEQAFKDACKTAGALIKAGVRVYCPIAHTHPIAAESGLDPYDHSIWLPADQPFIDNALGMIVTKMPNWELSKGITYEIKEFTAAGKPIVYLEWPLNEVSNVQK